MPPHKRTRNARGWIINAPWFRAESKTWYVTIRGKQKRLGRDEHGAMRKKPPPPIMEAWHRLERTQGDAPKDILYADLAEKYLATIAHPKTHEESKRQLDWFIAAVGRIKVSEMRVHHVTRYLETKPTWNSTSQAVAIERITRVLNWGQSEGYIEGHRVKLTRSQKPRRKRRVVVVAGEHAEAIENACYPRLRALLKVLRLSGARPSELCNLTIDKLDMPNGRAFVWNKTRETTGVEWRPLYLPEEAVDIIRQEVGLRTEGHVFRAYRNGKPFNAHNVAREVRRKRRALGLPEDIVPYAARHSFASNAINEKDINPAVVAKLLGHVGMAQIRTYYHEDEQAMKDAINKKAKD